MAKRKDLEIYGWVRWVEDGNDMVPFRTTDRRLVVYLDYDYAMFEKKMLETVSPETVWDIWDLLKRFNLRRICHLGANGKEISAKSRNQRSKSKAKPRKAKRGKTALAQMTLF